MTNIMVLAGVLVSIAVGVALITANELDSTRTELGRLEQLKSLTFSRLEEVIQQKQAAEGSRVMLKKLRQSKREQLNQYLID
jgi:hypothetical protein